MGAMKLLLSILLWQYTVSVTAGLVNQVRGPANVQPSQNVAAGRPVDTGEGGFVELQLNPGSYLRLHENSGIVFDSVVLSDIEVRITRGSALIESGRIDPTMPIKVTAGNLVALIKKPGLYRFSTDSAKVFNGELDLTNGTRIGKGYEATASEGGFDVKRVEDDEAEKPYAADKVRIFVEPKKDDSPHMQFMNSIFAELCRNELQYARDIEVVADRQSANYVLIASGGRQLMYDRVMAHAELMQTSDGKIEFSNSETRAEFEQVFLQPSHDAVNALIQSLLRKMHWR